MAWIYLHDALDYAYDLYCLANQLETSYYDHSHARDHGFVRFEGEARDYAEHLVDILGANIDLTVTSLEDAADAWTQRWISAVDERNHGHYIAEVAKLRTYLDSIQSDIRKNISTTDELVLASADAFDWLTNYRDDNPENLVDRPISVRDSPKYHPIPPLFQTGSVYVHYERRYAPYPPRSLARYTDALSTDFDSSSLGGYLQ